MEFALAPLYGSSLQAPIALWQEKHEMLLIVTDLERSDCSRLLLSVGAAAVTTGRVCL